VCPSIRSTVSLSLTLMYLSLAYYDECNLYSSLRIQLQECLSHVKFIALKFLSEISFGGKTNDIYFLATISDLCPLIGLKGEPSNGSGRMEKISEWRMNLHENWNNWSLMKSEKNLEYRTKYRWVKRLRIGVVMRREFEDSMEWNVHWS